MDINFSVQINAPREKVWSVLFDDATYRQWTAVFHEGSYAETDWQEGSKALFLGPGGKDGMVSTIARNIPNEFLSIKHLGTVKDGVEDTTSEEVQKWAGGLENYTLKEKDGGTELTVDGSKIPEEYYDYFTGVWPKALAKVKELSESK
jgi:uncharacterized protein YndB with AHSA1/START domain